MDSPDTYHIRPAGRHLLTIGSDLIQDKYAAVVELVKNAYDADSPDVEINFSASKNKTLSLEIVDHGHGMARETVINKWLVPSTNDKLKRKISPSGRVMQGRKGIGRYAASILGDDLLLETVTQGGEKTEVLIEWKKFENAEFLDDVEILVNTTKANQLQGTSLTITGGQEYLNEWDDHQLNKLKFELRKLIHPISSELFQTVSDEDFKVYLNFLNFFDDQKNRISEQIKPFPLLDLYDYRIAGTIDSKGKGILNYKNQKARNTIDKKINIDLGEPTNCGMLAFDIRVYDREAKAIDQLIRRGLKDDQGSELERRDAINMLNEYNGIGVYRNGFRIRPMGDPGFDWLELDRRRVQTPTLRIGSNQVIGFVLIESEELSGLTEKSARDGLKENEAYSRLIEITKGVIINLEINRYEYRMNAGLSRTNLKVERELGKLFAFEDLKENIRSRLKKAGISDEIASEIVKDINKKEDESNQLAEDIRQTVAIYQGQATLGKIINVVLHEGRRPLNFFKQQVRNLNFQANKLKKEYAEETLEKVLSVIDEFGTNADVLVELFGRLDPLAAGKRGKKKELNLKKVLNSTFHVFENDLLNNKIDFNVDCPEDAVILAWEQDIYAIMANLIDNSMFWMNSKPISHKEIKVIVNFDQNLQYIDYQDTGPGIEEHLIESEVIFEPDFSTKSEGTGLGLAIAGEAASRNGLELRAFTSNTGAYFRLQPKDG